MTVDDAFNLISGGHVVSDADLREILDQVRSEGYDDGWSLAKLEAGDE
jgi:hypothetical protein